MSDNYQEKTAINPGLLSLMVEAGSGKIARAAQRVALFPRPTGEGRAPSGSNRKARRKSKF